MSGERFAIMLFSFIIFSLGFSSAFEFNGTVYDEDGAALNNTLINITVRDNSDFSIVGYNTTTSNSTGSFNITLPDVMTWLFEVRMTHSNGSYIDFVGQSLPAFPSQVLGQIAGTDFYLLEAGTLNITAVNATGDETAFQYMVKDQKLGYEIAGNLDQENSLVNQATIVLPKNRNYSIMIFPNMSMPTTFDWNNFTSSSSYAFSDGLSDYNATTKTLHKKFNMTMGHGHVSGYINVSEISGWDDFIIVPYMMEPGNQVHATFGTMPTNLSSFFDQPAGSDEYNLSTGITDLAGYYNISLPSTVETSEMLLFAVARNGSSYWGGFHNLTLDYSTYSAGQGLSLNFTYMFGLLGDEANLSLEDPISGGNVNASTRLQTFTLVNESNSTLTDVFAHIESEVDYTAYGVKKFTWMVDVEQGSTSFSIPLLNVTGIDEMNVYASGGQTQYAPLRLTWSAAEIIANSNITLSSFEPQDIGGEGGAALSGLKIALFKSNSTCDVPNPDESCVIGGNEGGEEFGSFDPLSATMGGGKLSFRMGLLSSGIIIHYVNVDMLASGAPDALFDSEPTESTSSGFDSAMRFGSGGPTIYDHVLISMPYTEGKSSATGLNETGEVNMSIPLFYDEDWNVIWDTGTNGTNGTDLGGNESHYFDKRDEWEVLMGNNTCITNVSNLNSTNPCYIDTDENRIWIRLPHFSGTGPSITGSSITAESTSSESSSSSSGSGGSSPGGSILIPGNLLNQGYSVILGKGFKARMDVAGEEHTLEVVSILEGVIQITLRSDPQDFSLRAGEAIKADLTGDGYYDVLVSLTDIVNGRGRFILSSINEVVTPTGPEEESPQEDLASEGNRIENTPEEPENSSQDSFWLIAAMILAAVIIGSYLLKKKYNLK